jgi:hypothetical protein
MRYHTESGTDCPLQHDRALHVRVHSPTSRRHSPRGLSVSAHLRSIWMGATMPERACAWARSIATSLSDSTSCKISGDGCIIVTESEREIWKGVTSVQMRAASVLGLAACTRCNCPHMRHCCDLLNMLNCA